MTTPLDIDEIERALAAHGFGALPNETRALIEEVQELRSALSQETRVALDFQKQRDEAHAEVRRLRGIGKAANASWEAGYAAAREQAARVCDERARRLVEFCLDDMRAYATGALAGARDDIRAMKPEAEGEP